MTSAPHYDVYTGRAVAGLSGDSGPSETLSAAIGLGLEPPRFCGECGRRTVVQIVPDGWNSVCSRHGRTDSVALDRR